MIIVNVCIDPLLCFMHSALFIHYFIETLIAALKDESYHYSYFIDEGTIASM